MDVKYVNPFIQCLMNVLQTMANYPASFKKPYLKDGDHTLGEITGFIHMKGDDVECTMAIAFSSSAMTTIASKMIGEEITELDNETVDLAGEITNMVTGGVKKEFAKDGLNFDLSTPEFHVGQDYCPPHLKGEKVLVVPFVSDSGEFFLEASMHTVH